MERMGVVTNRILKKSESRLVKSKFNKQYELNSVHTNGMIIRGLYRSNKDLILEDSDGNHFLFPIFNQSKPFDSNSVDSQIPIDLKIVKVADLDYDPAIFIPMKTNQPIDFMFSTEGGIFPATNYMVIGDPGIGKSTQTLDILSQITKNDPTKRVLFISGEMNQIDMFGYTQRYPQFGQIPTIFLCDYIDGNPKQVLEQAFNQGWDLILMDSFIEIQAAIQASCGLTRTYAEKWLIDLMVNHNKGNNEKNLYTAFLAIQQVNKGGNFVGSNKLKHNTTGMIELRYSSEFSGDRYAKVTKNRRGFKYEKIYFSLDVPGMVEYDQKRIERDLEIQERVSKERNLLLEEEDKFNAIFNIGKDVETISEEI